MNVHKRIRKLTTLSLAVAAAAILLMALAQSTRISAQDVESEPIPLSHITPVVWEARGTGDSLSPSFNLSAGVVIVDVAYAATSSGILEIEFLKTDGSDSHSALFEFIASGGSYSGARAFNVHTGCCPDLTPGSYRIQINSEGAWHVDVSQPSRNVGVELPRFVQGSGDDGYFPIAFRQGIVPIYYEYSGPADGSGSILGITLYKMDGSERERLVYDFLSADEIPKSGIESVTVNESSRADISPGVYLLAVESEGDWRIALGAESFPSPTPTPEPTATPTSEPTATATAEPTATPTTVPTAPPTETPVPGQPTATPEPTATHTPIPTETPAETPAPTHTPVPTATPVSTPTVPTEVLNRISALETLVATLQGLISTLNSSISALNSSVSALTSRVATLEADASIPTPVPTPTTMPGETPVPTPTTVPGETPVPTPTQTPVADTCMTVVAADGAANGSWTSACATDRNLITANAAVGTRYAGYYTFALSQRSEVTITLESSEDTYLFLLSGHGRNGEKVAENDDIDTAAQNYNSRIAETLDAGEYTILATTYNLATTGNFTLTVSGIR